jgi:hypothetical protein
VADLVLICAREAQSRGDASSRLQRIAALLNPDGLTPSPARVIGADGVDVAIVHPTPQGVSVTDGGVCLGGLFGGDERWSHVGASAPDGTYALARYDAATVELLTDITASRAIWWALTDEALLASTSQRAMAALLGDLRLDPSAPAWLLSSGTLGPATAWDQRVSALPPDARLVLDRMAWRCHVDRRPAVFAAVPRATKEHVSALREAIAATCAELGLDLSQWLLPLSGGLDSRLILAGMASAGLRPRCITWTTASSRRDPLSDASIAPLVARHFGAPHRHEVFAEDGADPAAVLDRFVSAGEGRTDEFTGYVDGCAMWRDLADQGVSGVIRGDESAGERKRDAHDDGSRRGAGAIMVEDYEEAHVIRSLGLAGQEWPGWLHRQDGETREQYCDRMSQQVYVPMVLGPLNAIKGRFLEVINPLLSRRVIAVARELPDELRAYGRAIHRVAGSACPWIPYARNPSLPGAGEYLSRPDVIEVLVRGLTSADMARVLSEEGATRLLVAMAAPDSTPPALRARIFSALKAGSVVLPARAYDRLAPRYDQPDELSAARLALRATLASKTIALLEQDAGSLRGPATARRGD